MGDGRQRDHRKRVQLTKWQRWTFSLYGQIIPVIERGESASNTGRRHIPTRVFKQWSGSQSSDAVQEVLNSINPLNAARKEEAAALCKIFPRYGAAGNTVQEIRKRDRYAGKEKATSKRSRNASKQCQGSTGRRQNSSRKYNSFASFITAFWGI